MEYYYVCDFPLPLTFGDFSGENQRGPSPSPATEAAPSAVAPGNPQAWE
jgi:hypothetical protein